MFIYIHTNIQKVSITSIEFTNLSFVRKVVKDIRIASSEQEQKILTLWSPQSAKVTL